MRRGMPLPQLVTEGATEAGASSWRRINAGRMCDVVAEKLSPGPVQVGLCSANFG